MNRLDYGDNPNVLRESIASESIDRVYLDPPIESNQDYKLLYTDHAGTQAAPQITAFGQRVYRTRDNRLVPRGQ